MLCRSVKTAQVRVQWKKLVGQFLAELNAPLVKRVDAPNDPLNKDLVFIQGDEGTQSGGGQFGYHNETRRSVARVVAEGFAVGGGAAGHQSCRLCEHIY